MLHSVVTDLAWHPTSTGARYLPLVFPSFRGSIARRTVTGVPRFKLHASVLPHIARHLTWRREPWDRFRLADEALSLSCRLRGLRVPDVVVNYLGNGGSYLDYAKARGAKIVTDFIITSNAWAIEEEERRRRPAWGGKPISDQVIESFQSRMQRLLSISDVYLCPSHSVSNDLARFPEFDQRRVRITPYGAGGAVTRGSEPVTGRVLFAGEALLRKGLPYLGLAASRLKKLMPSIEIRVAGAATAAVRQQPEARDLTFLGGLDREAMTEEFASADVFCLPSLSEGSPSAIFEALAFGIPVVTTLSSGSVVNDGVEGFIVPERDPDGIAESLQRIVVNRNLRARMSEAALAAAKQYSDAACGEGFLNAIRAL